MFSVDSTFSEDEGGTQPFDSFLRDLLRAADHVQDYRPAFHLIADDFRDLVDEQFTTFGHGAWPDLSPRYEEWKRRVRPGRPIMVFDGTLRKQLTVPGGGGVEEYNAKSMLLGTGLPYAEAHQRGQGHMPRRQLIPHISEERVRAWTKIIQRHIIEGPE